MNHPDRVPDADVVGLSPEEWEFRHSSWRAKRRLVFAAIKRSQASENTVKRFAACGSFARAMWNVTQGRWQWNASYCKHRACEPCSLAKATRTARNVQRILAKRPAGRYRFITLTLRHTTAPLADQIALLLKSFVKLRRTPLFRKQHGGARFFECKIGRDGLWHPHLHCITEGPFCPLADLTRLWEKLTGGSTSVDVRKIPDTDAVAYEVTKYIAKGTSRDVWANEERAAEWLDASDGLRTCATWGTWRGCKLTEDDKERDELVFIGWLTDIYAGAARGQSWHRLILTCIEQNRPPPAECLPTVPQAVQSAACEKQTTDLRTFSPNSDSASPGKARPITHDVRASLDQLFTDSASQQQTPKSALLTT